jgi:GT2 family glycosyltransferase
MAIGSRERAVTVRKPAVSVVIVAYNAGDHLRRCLAALASQTVPPARIGLMNNDGAGGAALAGPDFPTAAGATAPLIELFALGENLGFAAANNQAIAMCETEFVALLNPDAFPHPDWLEKLLAAAERHPDAAAFGSRQMIDGQPGIVDGTGDVYHMSGLSWRKGHGRPLRHEDLVEREIFSPCAAAALYRRTALLEVGGFDERFFCYFEDVDLGFRLRLAGYKAIYVPDAVVDHVGGASSGGKRSDFAVYHGHRNLVWCFLKNMPNPLFLLLLPAHFAQSIFAAMVFLASGHGQIFAKAKWHAAKKVPEFWEARQTIQQTRRVSWWAIWKSLDKSLWRS